ncbi:MAG TPA: RsmB/NOP family class I SAM-dependent RNA methyltransferase [Burkholderiales bacterium]|nr:RsmB/NOP family class I SAM-dependent RNA methyltransferase [Burkholderiales bacterium]
MSLTAARLDMAVAAWRATASLSEPADHLLSRHFRDHHELGVRDRAFIADTLFGMLRHKRLIEFLAGNAAPRRLALAYLVKLAGLNLHDVKALLGRDDIKWLTQIKAQSIDDLPLGIQADLPDWLIEKLQRLMPDAEILALGRGMQNAAPLDLRVNTVRASREEVLYSLESEGVSARPTPFSPVGIRLKNKISLNRHALFLSGKVEVQDEGSQLVCYLAAPKRNEMIVDFCAGSGGKALLLAALMQSHGRVYAFDVSDKRLLNLKPRLKRSGLSNIFPQRIARENDVKIKRLAGKIDRVLVDAPCSGLGTLRRNPDLKWRQSSQGIAELKQKQALILESAAGLLKPGGRLVYATCSILPDENEEIVDSFLKQQPQFRQLDCGGILAQESIALDTGAFLRLLPHSHQTDGFFAAVMQKIE